MERAEHPMTVQDTTGWEAALSGYRLVFGPGSLGRVGELAREIGGSRVLIVTDSGVRDAGHVDRALDSLRSAGAEPFVHDRVEVNPTTRHVGEGVEAAREHGVDCLVGLGGGSAMDCAKAVNFIVTNGGAMEDYWGTGKADKPMLPSLGVPTTAGTGSEAQSYALICQEATGTKMACGDKKAMFRQVILDPALASSVPRTIAGIAGIDAVSHAVESYVATRRNPVSQMLAREAWRLLGAGYRTVLNVPDDIDAWGNMLLGAHLAGAAIEQSMLGAAHACANPLTARFPIPHGIAVGLMLPHVITFNSGHVGPLYDELRLAGDPGAPPGLLEDRIREMRAMAGLPESLRDYQIPRSCLPDLAVEAEQQWTAGFNPRPVTRAELLELYEAAYA
jgi:alcohol dehydrogenase